MYDVQYVHNFLIKIIIILYGSEENEKECFFYKKGFIVHVSPHYDQCTQMLAKIDRGQQDNTQYTGIYYKLFTISHRSRNDTLIQYHGSHNDFSQKGNTHEYKSQYIFYKLFRKSILYIFFFYFVFIVVVIFFFTVPCDIMPIYSISF